jgi:hypothetical protein
LAKELIVKRQPRRRRQRVTIINLDDFLCPVVLQLAVSDENANPTGVEERNVGAADAVDDARDVNRIVRPAP